jgi:hypothetical protein
LQPETEDKSLRSEDVGSAIPSALTDLILPAFRLR